MIKDILMNKLKSIGYFGDAIFNKLDEIDFNLLLKKEFSESNIELITYNVPDANIERVLVNLDGKYIQTKVIDGEVEVKTLKLPTGGRLVLMDFPLNKRLCVVSVTNEFNIEIMAYFPNNDYNTKTYSEMYEADRNSVIQDYLTEFTSSNRLLMSKACEVLSMLANDFVFDEMIISNSFPVFKLYNTPENFAAKITSYELKYINRRLNKIEIAEKSALLKRVSNNVKTGYISNDPYLKLSELNKYADFYINTVAYFWMYSNEKGVEEIGIYTAAKDEHVIYSKYIQRDQKKFIEKSREICMQFTNELGFQVSSDAIKDVLLKLNHQLVVPPVELILKYAENPTDPIEPLSYKFKSIVDSAEFEKRLYNSIEDNLGRRYKFGLAENVLENLTTIGNKLNYTNADGKIVRKQSIADYNQNEYAVIIRRETLIDEDSIPQLLGYIYDDFENLGTENLPVPSIEVDFYFPNPSLMHNGIKMFNGTNYEKMDTVALNGNSFYAIDSINNMYADSITPQAGSTKAKIRYLTNDKQILKENAIINVFPGDVYVPEIIPIINDKDGKEWVCKLTTVPRKILSEKPEDNIVEILYEPKMTKAKISFIDIEGKSLTKTQIVDIQVGTSLEKESYKTVIDLDGVEWNVVNCRPNKLVVDENETKNDITFVYNVNKVSVKINYKNKEGLTLKQSKKLEAVADKKYTAPIEPIITDDVGKSWMYISEAAATIIPSEGKENIIDLVYDELKSKVMITFENENGDKVLDDVVEFIQVGCFFSPTYQTKVIDADQKYWNFKSINSSSIKVNQDENKNIIKVIYTPAISKVTLKILTETGKPLLNDIVDEVQIGSSYSAEAHERVKDRNGKVWQSREHKSIIISEDETKNEISFMYEPLYVKALTKYLDDENKEIAVSKEVILQAGEKYKPDLPSSLIDKAGKKWVILESSKKEYIVDEQEVNTISIYYEKALTDVIISFVDLYTKKLIDDVTVKWQIGSIYDSNIYEKIKDETGARWSKVSSEPKNLSVKERGNHFIFIYDEIHTKVIIRYINVVDNTAFKEPDVVTAKLGGAYFPNIMREYIDSNRLHWIYAGEKELSIITKEEEQENIINLKYEPRNAKVTVRYLNERGEEISKNSEKDMQVGREVQIKRIEKVYSDKKLGYILKEMSKTIIRVDENSEKNVVTCYYEPLISRVKTVYKYGDNLEIIKPITNDLQVGKKFVAEIIDKVISEDGRYWNYIGEKEVSAIVTEQEQTLCLQYERELKEVRVRYIDEQGDDILPNTVELIQVGEKYVAKLDEIITDEDGKVWKFVKIDRNEIIVLEAEEDNIITIRYEKKMVDVCISFANPDDFEIRVDEKIKAQLGSILQYRDNHYIIDKTGLGWEVSKIENDFRIVDEMNHFKVSYVPYLVNVYDRFFDENNTEIIEAVSSKQQVGTKYSPEIKSVLIDLEDKEWLYVENKIFEKSSTIKVSENESENNAVIKYKPSLTDVTIEYVDSINTSIRQNTIVQAQIGSIYSADVIERITDSKGQKWVYNPNTTNKIKVKREGTVIALSYEEQKAIVVYKYQDEFGNRLKLPKKILVQVGTTFTPDIDTVIEDDEEKVWEYRSRDLESIEIKDTEQDNVFVLIYVPLKVDVTLFIKDNIGNEIIKPIKIKAQLGSIFKPNIETNITDDDSLLYRFSEIMPESIKVKEVPIGSESDLNVFQLIYKPVYSMAYVKYQDIDGNMLRDDEKVQLQVGSKFNPKKSRFIKDRKDNQWEILDNEEITIRIMENEKDNVVKFIYEIANADITVKYQSIDGISLQPDEKVNLQIGTEFVPMPPKYITDSSNKKWSYFNTEPVKLKIGSINNVITVYYQEEKAAVLIKYMAENGNKLKADSKILVQIGSLFKPKVSNRVIYDENEIWRFLRFEPKEIFVSENVNENIITQIYSNTDEVKEIKETDKDKTDTNMAQIPIKNDVSNNSADTMTKAEENNIVINPEKQQEGYVYKNQKLKQVDNVILLKETEKQSLDEISLINDEIMNKLYNATSFDEQLTETIEKLIDNEKEIVGIRLKDVIENDKTGSKLLKILEITLLPDGKYDAFDTLQQRKAVAMTDYFLNKPLDNTDQALYIYLKGKNIKQLEIAKAGTAEKNILMQLIYEKVLLENYYKARSDVKDKYFIDELSRQQVSSDISIIVNNMMTNYTYNLLIKDNLTSYQQIELTALYSLLNQIQRQNIEQIINKISDGRQRKNILKKIEMLKK